MSTLAFASLVAACSGNQLSPAQVTNVVDTVTLGAIHGAAVSIPAAYDITLGVTVRTDQSSSFDFVYDIDSLGRHVFLPLNAIGLGATNGTNPGLQKSSSTFTALENPPTDGYVSDSAVVIAVGDVIVARSRVSCLLGVPEYGKFHILEFADAAKTVRLEVLTNPNCGYRSLRAGIPTS